LEIIYDGEGINAAGSLLISSLHIGNARATSECLNVIEEGFPFSSVSSLLNMQSLGTIEGMVLLGESVADHFEHDICLYHVGISDFL
jgi:hypothetical protein